MTRDEILGREARQHFRDLAVSEREVPNDNLCWQIFGGLPCLNRLPCGWHP